MSNFETTNVLGFAYAELDYTEASELITRWGAYGESKTVVVAPVSSVIMAKRSPSLRAAFDDADMITSDGVPIVWVRKMMGRANATRLYGPDLMLHTLKACERANVSVALVGGRPERLNGLKDEINNRFPALTISYAWSPPFRDLSDNEVEELGKAISDSGAGVAFVGIGCPKQELLMARLKHLTPAVQIGVGAAFDFIPGHVKQAPAWMQRNGLEWAFRIGCEPRRLWKRYATTIPPFVLGATKQILTYHVRRSMSKVNFRRRLA